MLACLDVAYSERVAVGGCVVFRDWSDERAVVEVVASVPVIADYRPGEFYLRELPPLLAVLSRIEYPLDAIVIDGYVWLGMDRPGLGARLHEALGGKTPIVGVAKTAWRAHVDAAPVEPPSHRAIAVCRGESAKPLYVTSVDMDLAEAANRVARMHGPHRIPTLLKAVDRLVRQFAGDLPTPG